MATATLNEQAVLDQLRRVPQDRWSDVLSFIRSCQPGSQEHSREEKRPLTAAELLQSDVIGMWAERADIGDSLEFARRLREQAQSRRRDT